MATLLGLAAVAIVLVQKAIHKGIEDPSDRKFGLASLC